MAKKDILKLVKEKAEEILKMVEVPAKVAVSERDDNRLLQIETDEPGLLIGYHGQGISGLQQILNLMIYRQIGEWPRVVVNVGDYWEKRNDSLTRMARSIAQRVKFSGEDQALPPMSAAERRIAHLALADDPEVETVSEGEGRDRRVLVKLKKS